MAKLDSDQVLRQLLMKNLLHERVIKISRYSPSEKACQRNAKVSKAAIMIESKWKLYDELFAKNDIIDMYDKIAEVVKCAVIDVMYHLKK